MKRFNIIIILILISFATNAQRYIRKFEKWNRKEKYEKIARKSPKFTRKYSKDPRVFYYASYAELQISKNKTELNKGYKNILNSVRYFIAYKSTLTKPQITTALSDSMHKELRRYYDYFTTTKRSQSLRALDLILASTFNDTTDNFRNQGESNSTTNYFTNSNKESKSQIQKRNAIIAEAEKHKGKPYKYAAEGPNSFDCSGFTLFVIENATGIRMPHNASMQSKLANEIKHEEAQPGDLIFFGNKKNKSVNHTGIVYKTGNGKIQGVIHCVSRGVSIDTYDKASWTNHWEGRIVKVIDVMEAIKNVSQ